MKKQATLLKELEEIVINFNSAKYEFLWEVYSNCSKIKNESYWKLRRYWFNKAKELNANSLSFKITTFNFFRYTLIIRLVFDNNIVYIKETSHNEYIYNYNRLNGVIYTSI